MIGNITTPKTLRRNWKYLIALSWSLLFISWRSIVYLKTPLSSPHLGTIQGTILMQNRCYQRGIKIHLIRTDKRQPEITFPTSYSGTMKKYNIPPGRYKMLITKHGFHPLTLNITVKPSTTTKIPTLTLKPSSSSNYFYHLTHALNIGAFCLLLAAGIGIYLLRRGDNTAKAFLRFCLIMSFWNLWGILAYILEPIGKKRIGGHLTYLSLWSYSFIGPSYCHVLLIFPQPLLGEKTRSALSWLYLPALLLSPFELIRILFWYRPDYSRFLGFRQEITDSIIMLSFILYLLTGNLFLLINTLRVREKTEKLQLFFLLTATSFPPALFSTTLGAMYLLSLNQFFDNDMIFFTSSTQIIVSIAFTYSFVMFDLIRTKERMKEQERLAFIGLMDAKLTHDIRSLATVIRNLSSTLHYMLTRYTPLQELLSLNDEIKNNAQNLLNLISDIRRELKGDEITAKPTKIEDVVSEAMKTALRSTTKKVKVKTELPADLPPIPVNPFRFTTAIVNILQNSIDSFKEEGNIEITGHIEGDKVKLTIKDDGCGIPESEIDKIFSSLYSTKEDGMGLGLFFAKEEVTGYGGEISCSSQPGKGTTITITLPRPHPPLNAATCSHSASPLLSSGPRRKERGKKETGGRRPDLGKTDKETMGQGDKESVSIPLS